MKITKSQLKEIIKEEVSRLQKKTILENRKKEIVKELRILNEEAITQELFGIGKKKKEAAARAAEEASEKEAQELERQKATLAQQKAAKEEEEKEAQVLAQKKAAKEKREAAEAATAAENKANPIGHYKKLDLELSQAHKDNMHTKATQPLDDMYEHQIDWIKGEMKKLEAIPSVKAWIDGGKK